MNYLHLATNTATPLHVIRAAHPHMSIPDGADLTGIGYAKLHPTTPPTPGPNQRVVAGEPVLVGGEWREDWGVVALTPEEVAERDAEASAAVQAAIIALEREHQMPRVTRESLIALAEEMGLAAGLTLEQLKVKNKGYAGLKALDEQIAALRAQL